MEDLELIEGLLARRDDAVRFYLERFLSSFRHCISYFEADENAREELQADIAWHVLERLTRGGFDPTRGSLSTFVYRVAWCRCVDIKRRSRQHPTETVELTNRVESPDQVHLQASKEEQADYIRSAASQLRPIERALLELRFVEDLDWKEISQRLSLTPEQAKHRVGIALSHLRTAFVRQTSAAKQLASITSSDLDAAGSLAGHLYEYEQTGDKTRRMAATQDERALEHFTVGREVDLMLSKTHLLEDELKRLREVFSGEQDS